MTQAHAPITEPTAEPTTPVGSIRLVVDLNRCQAYAQCCFMAPGVFTLHGAEALWYDPAPDASQRENVLRAAAACPVQAIHVERSEALSRQHRKPTMHSEHMEDRYVVRRT